jgi:DNA-binding response OmpR family regulator
MTARVLVVDDILSNVKLLEAKLTAEYFEVMTAFNGRECLSKMEQVVPDIVLLDVMMPGMDGLSVLRKIREQSDVPVIMLTAKGDETDRVVGLELGADDYLPKPFSPRELLARLRAVIRRTQARGERRQFAISGVTVDLESRRIERDGRSLELTGLEFDLLVALMQRAGRVVARSALMDLAGRNDVNVNDRAVDVHVSHLRRKLGDDPPRLIRTVLGVGYMFAREEP